MPEARLLLGWYDRDTAVNALKTGCVFDEALTDGQAEELWRPYRERVEQLEARPQTMPPEYPLSAEERRHVKRFLRRARSSDRAIDTVIKIDPLLLAVHQLIVLTEHADGYVDTV